MMHIKKIGAGIAVFFVLITFWLSAYRVQEYERAVLTRFGEYKEIVGPGLHWKFPYIDSATFFQISIQEIIQSKVNTYTVDNQQLDARIVVFYRIPAASIEYIYKSVPDLAAQKLFCRERDAARRLPFSWCRRGPDVSQADAQ